jgi:L,D-transpeptidase YbiS
VKSLESRVAAAAPKSPYIVVDRVNNVIRLCSGRRTILEAPCSTGSGKKLDDPAGDRGWEFNTPQGMFRVVSKLEDPVWRKPDWAFIEEGEPVPARDSERFEYGSLGEYGLAFGDGYLIHGTLYERLLGRSVSHGCIRVGRDALRTIYEACPAGTAIFIH